MILDELNTKQKQAAGHIAGPLLIMAGAGAGKTKTITHRIAYLIENGVSPDNILAVTFTNKAAKEMRDRIMNLLRARNLICPWGYNEGPTIATFHSLGVQIIREFADCVGIRKNFVIFDKGDSLSAIKQVMKAQSIDPKEYEPRKILALISKQKGLGNTHADFSEEDHHNYFVQITDEVWGGYEKFKKEKYALDFDDLLLKTLVLLETHSDIREKLQKRWLYIHIDEYQDTNNVQYRLMKLLIGPEKNICVVGDADQAIYSWRGADYNNILNFEKDFPGAHTVLLEENYRSTKTIIAASNDIISKNKNRKDKTLYTKNTDGEKITLRDTENERGEAIFVVETVKELVSVGIKPENIAVLYRTNFLSRILEESFLTSGVPYQVLGTRFFDRKEIKDMLAYLRAAENPDEFVSIERIINMPRRGIGKVTLAKIAAGKLDELSASVRAKVDAFYDLLSRIRKKRDEVDLPELFKFILDETGLEAKLVHGTEEEVERLENIYELVTIAGKYNEPSPEERIEHFLTDAALMTSEQDQIKEGGGVKLMTVHAAKGLEFSHVFVVGLEEGLFPHDALGDTNRDPEEERRLFYVAITRAKQKLYLSYAQSRMLYGREQVNIPSEFLLDIDDAYIEREEGSEPIITISI